MGVFYKFECMRKIEKRTTKLPENIQGKLNPDGNCELIISVILKYKCKKEKFKILT
jgi:hypothetical protein